MMLSTEHKKLCVQGGQETKEQEANSQAVEAGTGILERVEGCVCWGWGEEGQGTAGAIGHWLNGDQ